MVKPTPVAFSGWPTLGFATQAYDWYYAQDGNTSELGFNVVCSLTNFSVYQYNLNGTSATWGAVSIAMIGF